MTAGEINRTEKNLLVYSKLQTEIFFFKAVFSRKTVYGVFNKYKDKFMTDQNVTVWTKKQIMKMSQYVA